MNTTQLRQIIDHYLDQLSSDRLRLVVDFISFLVQKEHREQPNTNDEDTNDYRPPNRGSLLRHTMTWQGDDFEDCLQTVYETRSQIQA
ncbi:hypothetical protein [Lyngbya confervoides]|uniref:DUF2281 domain-containing protein n=1 Tax=Lyngbya confervoides BDU141951 TaxID=1574623 RepID=A0ABD4T0I0_9CYAN|nr:hypothetical protein [Lyngbya confervoides]MCM1982072.1 hypothetical protein [Lyngbya confervoides BDU141951]